jgi:acyl-coenzyme A thioesterase PaaI-like protein
MWDAIRKRYGDQIDQFLIPPPVFLSYQGQILDFDPKSNSLSVQFPILNDYLNPFGIQQGGITAAMVDNAIGPLSFLIAPPNITRRLHLKFIQPIKLVMDHIIITCCLEEKKGPRMIFKAEVFSPSNVLLAKAKSIHWITDTIWKDI